MGLIFSNITLHNENWVIFPRHGCCIPLDHLESYVFSFSTKKKKKNPFKSVRQPVKFVQIRTTRKNRYKSVLATWTGDKKTDFRKLNLATWTLLHSACAIKHKNRNIEIFWKLDHNKFIIDYFMEFLHFSAFSNKNFTILAIFANILLSRFYISWDF